MHGQLAQRTCIDYLRLSRTEVCAEKLLREACATKTWSLEKRNLSRELGERNLLREICSDNLRNLLRHTCSEKLAEKLTQTSLQSELARKASDKFLCVSSLRNHVSPSCFAHGLCVRRSQRKGTFSTQAPPKVAKHFSFCTRAQRSRPPARPPRAPQKVDAALACLTWATPIPRSGLRGQVEK